MAIRSETVTAGKVISDEQIIAALQNAVHYSAKTVNSKASTAGVRIASSFALAIPYVCGRSLLHENQPLLLDYAGGAANAGIFRVINTAFGKPEENIDQDSRRVSVIQDLISQHTQNALTVGGQRVDIRSRQLLIPNDSGGYISFTPLTSAGSCYYINRIVDQNNLAVCKARKLKKEAKLSKPVEVIENSASNVFLPLVHLGIGGSHGRNVGSWVREMQRPLYLTVPKVRADVRDTLSLFYNGIDFKLSEAIQQEIADLNRQALLDGQVTGLPKDVKSQNLRKRNSEKQLIRRMAAYILAQGEDAFEQLKRGEAYLPSLTELPRESYWLADSVVSYRKALINEDYRRHYHDWADLLAGEMAGRIINHTSSHGKEKLRDSHMDTANARDFLTRRISEALRNLTGETA